MARYALMVTAIVLVGCASTNDDLVATALPQVESNPELLQCGFNRAPVCRKSGCRCELIPYTIGGDYPSRMPARRR